MKKSLIIFLTFFLLSILSVGFYNYYKIFYCDYFSGASYTQTAFIGNTTPSKIQILLSRFSNLTTICTSMIIAIFFTLVVLKIKKVN